MKGFIVVVLVGVIIVAWCPWFKIEEAKQLIYNQVYQSQSTLHDGCVLTVDNRTLEKIAFGYKEVVSYTCTYNTDFLSDGKNTVIVLFSKQVLNVPHPIIK